MFTRCPNCRAAFSITDQQLAIASGMVRCGVCEHVFDARLYLFKQSEEREDHVDLPLESSEEIAENAQIDFAAEAEFIQNEKVDSATKAEPNEQLNSPQVPKIIADEVSNLGHERIQLNPFKLLGFGLAGIFAAILLLQFVAVYKIKWLPDNLRVTICNLVTCVEEVPRAIDKIEILNRSIFTHPQQTSALMVTVTFVNRAEFAQPYPIVQLRFLDVSGDIIAARQFNPREYLGSNWSRRSIMPPARPTSIQLEVVDFGEDVVGYEFDFL